eukprot:TRINITY_DN9781_c0_g1_i1.p1 TRINITY_DN9781_c0_g1~~TRINITY_DN9781_c0_g1_i1.p1  ORF type:complete len:521 (-),score=92.76 TRINITY_DN9781_c0_g1_i1:103-1665(-)
MVPAKHMLIIFIACCFIFSLLQLHMIDVTQTAYRPIKTDQHPPSSPRPNIVFIITDDQDIATESLNYMPHLRRLIAEPGMTFSNAFATTSLCAPSRASIFTGQYAHNHPFKNHDVMYHHVFPPVENETASVWLQRAGYDTALFGKYFNGYGEYPHPTIKGSLAHEGHVPPGWSRWFSTVQGMYFDPLFSDDGELTRVEGYHTDLLANRSVEYLWDHARTAPSTPVFMYIGAKAPHAPFTPAQRHQNMFTDVDVPKVPSFNEPDSFMSTKPYPLDKVPPMTKDMIDKNRYIHRQRLRTLQAVDEMVRDVVDALDKLAMLNNTYIFYTSDHGYQLGQHRLWNLKSVSYEESIRIPLFVRGPGITPGSKTRDIALNIDFASTWLDLAGALFRAPSWVDGVSLVPSMLHQRSTHHNNRELFVTENFEAPGNNIDGMFNEIKFNRGVRALSADGRVDVLFNSINKLYPECYIMLIDPYQLNNKCKHIPLKTYKENPIVWKSVMECKGYTCRNTKRLSEYDLTWLS